MEWNIEGHYISDEIPRTYTLFPHGLRIIVTRHIRYNPDEWILNCEPFFYHRVIGNRTADEAKEAAIKIIKERLLNILESLK